MEKERKNLQCVYLSLREEWRDQTSPLQQCLKKEGIRCEIIQGIPEDTIPAPSGGTVLVTDNPDTAQRGQRKGMVCVGCGHLKGYFPGAVLVLEGPDQLDARTLEKIYCHEKGIPVCIATTERLVLRELAETDLPFWLSLGQSAGMEYVPAYIFREDYFKSYISHQYRFFGYGLWIAVGTDGSPAGCCGFHSFSPSHMPEASDGVELQYMLLPKYRHRGYGQEMGRAALDYAAEYPELRQLYLRVHRKNMPSLKLAEKLGFKQLPEMEKVDTYLFSLTVKTTKNKMK